MCNSEWYKNQTFPIIIFQYPVPERRKLNDQGSCCYNSLWLRSLLLWDCAQQSHLVHYNSLNVPLMAELIIFFYTHSLVDWKNQKKSCIFLDTHLFGQAAELLWMREHGFPATVWSYKSDPSQMNKSLMHHFNSVLFWSEIFHKAPCLGDAVVDFNRLDQDISNPFRLWTHGT